MNQSTSATVPNLDTMTGEEIEALPPDDFADAFFSRLESRGAQITRDEMKEVEEVLQRQRTARQCALALLSEPWSQLNKRVGEDRGFAVVVAEVMQYANEVELYSGLAGLMKTAGVWCMAALAGREDMAEIIKEAKAA
jgi:hypothetical protein